MGVARFLKIEGLDDRGDIRIKLLDVLIEELGVSGIPVKASDLKKSNQIHVSREADNFSSYLMRYYAQKKLIPKITLMEGMDNSFNKSSDDPSYKEQVVNSYRSIKTFWSCKIQSYMGTQVDGLRAELITFKYTLSGP